MSVNKLTTSVRVTAIVRRMIKAVIFDLFGVLTTDSWQAFVDQLPPEVDKERVHELNHQRAAGFINEVEFTEQLGQLTNKTSEQINDELRGEVAKNTALLDYIREIKQHFSIGLLSNIASNWVRESFLTEEEQSLFDEMILSFEVGMTKPDQRIFMLACERLRVGPHEAVLVDDIESYCQAARAEGMQAVVYRDLQQLKTELRGILYPK